MKVVQENIIQNRIWNLVNLFTFTYTLDIVYLGTKFNQDQMLLFGPSAWWHSDINSDIQTQRIDMK